MIVILDLETQELIPGNRDITDLRISIAGIQHENTTHTFQEHNIQDIFKFLDEEELNAYLMQDLQITKKLFEHVQQHGKLKYGHINYKEPVEREVMISIADR